MPMFTLTRRDMFLAGALPAAAAVPNATPGGRRSRLPNPRLLTDQGRTVRFYDDLVRGRIVAVSFFYVRCTGICPRTMENLVEVQRLLGDRMGRDIFMYSVTLTPGQDTPRDLREYRVAHGIKRGWTLLTGQPAEVEHLRRGLGFTDPDPVVDADRSQHSGLLVYGSEPRDSWGALPVLSTPAEIAKAITRLAG
jgi:protein SCO1